MARHARSDGRGITARIDSADGANHLHRRRHEDDVVELHAVGRRREPLRRAVRRGVQRLERVKAPQAVRDDRQMLRGLPDSGLFPVEHDLLKLSKERGSNGVSRPEQQDRPDDVARKIGDDVPEVRRIQLAAPQAADRLLQRRSHGLRAARHRDADRRSASTARCIANVAHGLITGLLFFLAGAIKDRHHTADLDGSAAASTSGCRGSAACSRSPPSPASGCPAWPASGARCSRCSAPSTRRRRCPAATTWC